MRLITDYEDNLLLIDEDTSAIGDDFVWDTNRVKFVCSEDESTTVDKKIIAASPKLGDLPLLPELPKSDKVEKYHKDLDSAWREYKDECEYSSPVNIIQFQEIFDLLYKDETKQEEDVEQLMYEAIDYTLQCANGYQEGNYEVSFMYPANNIAYQKLLKAKERYKASSKKWSDEDMVAFAIHTWDTGESTLEILKKWKRTLSPTSPIGFEPEWEYKNKIGTNDNWWTCSSNLEIYIRRGDEMRLKIVNGVLQGRWIYG